MWGISQRRGENGYKGKNSIVIVKIKKIVKRMNK